MPEKFVAFLFVVCSGASFEIALPEKKHSVSGHLTCQMKTKTVHIMFQLHCFSSRKETIEGNSDSILKNWFNKERRYAQRCKAAFKDLWHSLFVLLHWRTYIWRNVSSDQWSQAWPKEWHKCLKSQVVKQNEDSGSYPGTSESSWNELYICF